MCLCFAVCIANTKSSTACTVEANSNIIHSAWTEGVVKWSALNCPCINQTVLSGVDDAV